MACHFSGRWIYSVGYFTLNARWIWLVPGTTILVDPGRERIERVFNLKYPLEYTQRPEKVDANQQAFADFYRSL